MPSTFAPTDDEKDELLLSCRYGELEEIQQFVEKFGNEALTDVHDANGNTVLHMVCANGHTGEHPIHPHPSHSIPADTHTKPYRCPYIPAPPRARARRLIQRRPLNAAALGRAKRTPQRRTGARALPRWRGRGSHRRKERRGTHAARRGGARRMGGGCALARRRDAAR